MRLDWLNFPWVGRNPFKIGMAFSLLFLVVFTPQIIILIVAARQQHPAFVLWPAGAVILIGPLMWALCFGVARAMNRVRRRADEAFDIVMQSDCLMVSGILQTPGIAQICGDRLVLTPLIGKTVDLALSEVCIKSETRQWFNGSLMMNSAAGIWLSVPGHWRLGFAVPDVGPWRERLSGNAAVGLNRKSL